jgi:hypothetical protein
MLRSSLARRLRSPEESSLVGSGSVSRGSNPGPAPHHFPAGVGNQAANLGLNQRRYLNPAGALAGHSSGLIDHEHVVTVHLDIGPPPTRGVNIIPQP